MVEDPQRRCVLVMGGSFDPVHLGHVGVASWFVKALAPDVLRIIPAGNPWQRAPLTASPDDRIAMIRLAFERLPVPVQIDVQEIERASGSYTIDTLRALRQELGAQASLCWIIGADQLTNLNTWRDWRALFELAHFCVAARPGHALELETLPADVGQEVRRRLAPPDQLPRRAQGLVCIAPNLCHLESSTEARAAFSRGSLPKELLTPSVLDYIQQRHLYRT